MVHRTIGSRSDGTQGTSREELSTLGWSGGVHRTIHYNESHSHGWAMSWLPSGGEEENGVRAG